MIKQPPNAVSPLVRAGAIRPSKVVAPAPGMCIDIAKGRRLQLEINQDAGEKDVLKYIREIARVKIMPVVQKDYQETKLLTKRAVRKSPGRGNPPGSPRGTHGNRAGLLRNKFSLL